jgi:DNA uptake protein ComE-like DNA-binding protein
MKLQGVLAVSALIALAACSTDAAKTADSAAAAVDTSAVVTVPADTMPAAAPTGGMMDPNAATATDLGTIPGVTAEIANAVVAARPFANNVALEKVLAANLSEQQRDSVYARLWAPIDLNTATDAEILLIPGVGSRMLHEFKEYRPYTSMEQFRREIGKYVDKTELERLAMYVSVK